MSDFKEIVEEKRPSIMVATPMYGGMCTGHYLNGILVVDRTDETGQCPGVLRIHDERESDHTCP
jgi:hypothetical protein